MVEFIHHFEKLVTDKKGKIVHSTHTSPVGFITALLPLKADIQRFDTIQGGVALKYSSKEVQIRSFIYRHLGKSGLIIPQETWNQIFYRHEVEEFVIETYSHIEAIRIHVLEEAVKKFKETKKLSKAFSLRTLAQKVNSIVLRSDTKQLLSHYVAEEDQRCINPLGTFGKRLRRSQLIDRFDAVNAISSMARDTPHTENRWKLMEFSGRLLWLESLLSEISIHEKLINGLYTDRMNYLAGRE